MGKILVIQDSKLMQNKVVDVLRRIVEDDITRLDNANMIFSQANVYLENVKLIITDTSLPGISGIELTRKIKNSPQYCNIPVIFLTADGNSDTVREAIKAGANDYIVVPIEEEELILRLKKFLSNSVVERKNREVFMVKEEAIDLIDVEIQRCLRGKQTASFMVIELKKENMEKTLEIVKAVLRKVDIIRIIEERLMLIILPFTNEDGLKVVIDKISNQLLKENIQIGYKKTYTYKYEENATLAEVLEKLGLK